MRTRRAACSTSRRCSSSGSWVVMPTGQRPVWQWWQKPGLGAERRVVLFVQRRVAVQRDQRRGADRDRIGAERHGLGDVRPAPDAARHDQLHLAVHVELVERLDRLAHRRQGRNADMLDEHVLGGAGAALHAVQHDRIGPGLDAERHVEAGARRADLDVDRLLPVGDLAQLGDLDREIVRAGPVGMAAGAALVDALRQRAHRGDPLGDLEPEQHAAAAGLGALADHHLDRIGAAQVVRIEAVARRQHLIDQGLGRGALLVGHAAIAGGRAGAHGGGGAAERLLGMRPERAEAHAGDGDRDRELDRLRGKAGADRDVGRAPFPIALERIAGDRGAEEHQIVEGRQPPFGAEAPDVVQALARGALDLGDHALWETRGLSNTRGSIAMPASYPPAPDVRRRRARRGAAAVARAARLALRLRPLQRFPAPRRRTHGNLALVAAGMVDVEVVQVARRAVAPEFGGIEGEAGALEQVLERRAVRLASSVSRCSPSRGSPPCRARTGWPRRANRRDPARRRRTPPGAPPAP